MSRLARLTFPFTALALALGVVACGSSEPSADDFRAEADEVCFNGAKDDLEVEHRLGIPEAPVDEVALAERLIENEERTLFELEELEAPSEVAEQWDRYLRVRRQQATLREEQLKPLREADEVALVPINKKIVKGNGELAEAGEAAEFTACANLVPKGQAKEAEEVVEEVALTTDPKRVCDELVTEEHLESSFGSFEACVEWLKENAEDLPEEIEVVRIDGVGRVQAGVRITEIGGGYDGDETVWMLHWEDGGWKLNEVLPGI